MKEFPPCDLLLVSYGMYAAIQRGTFPSESVGGKIFTRQGVEITPHKWLGENQMAVFHRGRFVTMVYFERDVPTDEVLVEAWEGRRDLVWS